MFEQRIRNRTILTVALAVLMAVVAFPAAASAVGTVNDASSTATVSVQDQSNNSSVNVTAGQQLSTVLSVTSDEVQSDVQNAAFEVSFESASEDRRARVGRDRAEELRHRSNDIRREYENVTAAYEAGEISRSQYAQRLATLNARAANVQQSYRTLQDRIDNVSESELSEVGLNRSVLNESMNNLSAVSGTGPQALLNRFTGQSTGEVELRTANGLSIEVEGEDGEQSREIRRARDSNNEISISRDAALETAQSALSSQNGSWALEEASVHPASGYYKFEYVLTNSVSSGETEIRVDGSTGDIFRIEEEIEAEDDDDDEDEREREGEGRDDDRRDDDDDRNRSLTIEVVNGTVGPNEDVTIQVSIDGTAAEGVPVTLNGDSIGRTSADGTLQVTLPNEEAEFRAERGDAEDELEFEFENETEHEEDEHETEHEEDERETEDDDETETETEGPDDS